MTVGSLFSGIGGFDLGLTRAGYDIKFQVEIDSYCNRVLAKHWPHVTRYGDIKLIDWSRVEPVDVICGGFPCQPFSLIGPRRQEKDARNLWPEMRRAVEALRPTWMLGENVPGVIPYVLAVCKPELEAMGYRVRVYRIPACFVGSPQERQRAWIIAYAQSQQTRAAGQPRLNGSMAGVPVTHAQGLGWQQRYQDARRHRERTSEAKKWTGSADGLRWPSPPNLRRMDVRVPKRMDRVKGLGNAIVPQIVEWLGRQILVVEEAS